MIVGVFSKPLLAYERENLAKNNKSVRIQEIRITKITNLIYLTDVEYSTQQKMTDSFQVYMKHLQNWPYALHK